MGVGQSIDEREIISDVRMGHVQTGSTSKSETKCSYCSKPNASKKCSKCLNITYCSRECQVADWKNSHKAKCGLSKEDLEFQQKRTSCASTEQADMVNMMMKMAVSCGKVPPKMSFMKNLMEFYEQVPDLEKEFVSYMKHLNILDIPSKSLDLLREKVILTRALYLKEFCFYDTMGGSSENALISKDPSSLIKVLNSSDMQKVKWYYSAPMFDVYDRTSTKGYEFSLYHSFSNCRARKERFETGRTHVAIGFVDLSLLLQMDLFENRLEPFHFVGFEASPFSVAKTLVIHTMFGQKDDKIIDAILQVWYSSCWSDDTYSSFKWAVSEVMATCRDKEVLELLTHWNQAKPQTISYARQQWVQKIDSSALSPVCNMLDSNNRNILTQYFLTGQLLPATCKN